MGAHVYLTLLPVVVCLVTAVTLSVKEAFNPLSAKDGKSGRRKFVPQTPTTSTDVQSKTLEFKPLVSEFKAFKEVYYVAAERFNVTYFNPEYIDFINASTSRPGRWDPKYYFNGHIGLRRTMYNNSTVDYWFYEFRSNEYRRGFVEMHFRLCDLILKDFFFGPAFRANNFQCPIQPGEYYWRNMSIPDLPLLRTFPFRKGRIYCTWSLPDGVHVADGYVDIEIKMRPLRPARSKNMNRTLIV